MSDIRSEEIPVTSAEVVGQVMGQEEGEGNKPAQSGVIEQPEHVDTIYHDARMEDKQEQTQPEEILNPSHIGETQESRQSGVSEQPKETGEIDPDTKMEDKQVHAQSEERQQKHAQVGELQEPTQAEKIEQPEYTGQNEGLDQDAKPQDEQGPAQSQQVQQRQSPSPPHAHIGEAQEPAQSDDSLASAGGHAPAPPSIDSNPTEHLIGDGDSAVGGLSINSSTASLRSSIYEHVEENGRTYHSFKSGKYQLPNDEQEQERLDIQHALFRLTLDGKLFLAPLHNPQNVLDLATGTGLWAVEFAQENPSASVLGTDLSAIQPLYVPPNLRFEIDDAEDEWIFSETFDYVHGRALLSCFKDPKYVFSQAFKSLSPGGYLEMQDMIFPFEFLTPPPENSPLKEWFEIISEGASRLARPWNNVQHYKRWMEELGFEDVREEKYYWPINNWPRGRHFKHIAVYAQADFLNGLEGMSLKVMGSMGWSADAVQAFLIGVRQDVKDTNIHCYCPMNVVYGRKPGGRQVDL